MTVDASPVPLDGFDPFDPAQAGRHHEVMAQLRQSCPVARLSSGMIALSRYDDVRATLNEPSLRNSHAARSPGVSVPPEDRMFFFEYDPPEHVALRRLVVDLLSRSVAERQAPAMRRLAETLLAPLVAAGRADVVAGFSVPFAGRLMMRIAGFPESDAPQWRLWIKDMVLSGFSFTNRNDRGTGFEQCYPEVLAYLDHHLEARETAFSETDSGATGGPGTVDPASSGVLARVRHARLGDSPLPRTLQRMILFSVVSAGTNTLVNFVSNTVLSLACHPEILASLRSDRTLIPAAVEESLRRDSPSMYITRLCAEPTEVAGTAVGAGEKLLLGLASANRDGSAFPDPERFRLDRDQQPPHLAFGWGSHLCLGAWVARQAGAAVLETVLEMVDRIELEPGTVPVPYLSPQGNGLDELRVQLFPA